MFHGLNFCNVPTINNMAPTSWVHGLSKAELMDELGARDLDRSGNFEVLRRRLKDYVISQPDLGMLGQRMVQRWPRRHNVVETNEELSNVLPEQQLAHDRAEELKLRPSELVAVERGIFPGKSGDVSGESKLNLTVVTNLVESLAIVDGTNPALLCEFLIHATEIVDLELVPLRSLVMLLVSRTTGRLSRDLITMVKGTVSWEAFCRGLLEVTCPMLVREDLIMSYVTRRFQTSNETFDTYVNLVFQAARVLSYVVPESTLVNVCLQNMLPDNKLHLTFCAKPTSRDGLKAVGREIANALFLQRVASQHNGGVSTNLEPPIREIGNKQGRTFVKQSTPGVRCWLCGVWGHRQNQCPTKSRSGCTLPPPSGNGPRVRN